MTNQHSLEIDVQTYEIIFYLLLRHGAVVVHVLLEYLIGREILSIGSVKDILFQEAVTGNYIRPVCLTYDWDITGGIAR